MAITTLRYIGFFLLVVFIYYCLPKKVRWPYLLICSFVYMLLSGAHILVLYPLFTIFVAWICTRFMVGADEKHKKKLLTVAIVLNLAVLIVLKYLNLGIYTYNALISVVEPTAVSLKAFSFLAPIGLSFYTMSILAYIFDVYYGICEPEKNYFKLLLFGLYFPLIVSGPIVRYKDMSSKLYEGHALTYKNITYGAQQIVLGFFKVLVIAEHLSPFTTMVFADYQLYDGLVLLIAAICFVMVLYMNFSGSMDIIMGISRMLGIELPENFRQPFFSESIQEFWQRWHITLGAWLKDYILYPVLRTKQFVNLSAKLKEKFGKKKAKQLTTFLALFITWFVVGLWHGGAWKYIFGVGILQCIFIIISELTTPIFDKFYKRTGIDSKAKVLKILRKVRTFILIAISFVFFNANSLTDGFKMLAKMCHRWNPSIFTDGTLVSLGLVRRDWLVVGCAVIIAWVISLIASKVDIYDELAKKNIVLRWCILYAMIFIVVLMGCYGPGYDAAEFIYQGF